MMSASLRVLCDELRQIAELRCLFRNFSGCLLQFDFPFIQTFRVSRFRFRPTSAFDELAGGGGDDLGESSSEVRISTERQLQDLSNTASVWNCDGEIIDEPFIDFR